MLSHCCVLLLLLFLASSSTTTHAATAFIRPHHHPLQQLSLPAKPSSSNRRRTMSTSTTTTSASSSSSSGNIEGMEQVLIVELGFGCDQHGQDATKAAIKACRNAIEWNSLPAMRQLIPSGSYDDMKIRLQLAVPGDEKEIDQEKVKKVFPYGKLLPIEFQRGGMLAKSGIALPEMGDTNDDWVVVVAAVTVGW